MSESQNEVCCTRCGEKLSYDRVEWLELDQRIHCYHDFGNVPERQSQGEFPFGRACAHRERQKARAALTR